MIRVLGDLEKAIFQSEINTFIFRVRGLDYSWILFKYNCAMKVFISLPGF